MVSDKDIKALSLINEKAREYAAKSKNCVGSKEKRKNSYKKKALYSTKEKLLEKLQNEADEIQVHVLQNSGGNSLEKYYYFKFSNRGFHAPLEELDVDDGLVTGRKYVGGISESGLKSRNNLSIEEALEFVEEKYSINANEFLPESDLSYDRPLTNLRDNIEWDI